MAKIGIPRALLYYEYYPMWKTFFEELGVEVVVSEKTNKTILNDGVITCVDDACLPVKLFHGHIVNLKDKVDYLFIPRLKSVAQWEYICPKFCGLPEMIKFSISNLPLIIDTEINLRKPKSDLFKPYKEIGNYFTKNSAKIRHAYNRALTVQKKYTSLLRQGKYPSEILENEKKLNFEKKKKLCIAVIGHVYNIYDEYINMNLISKLDNEGVDIITSEFIDDNILDKKANSLDKKLFWTYGKRLLAFGLHLLDRNDIDGVIYVMSFECGVDAFISDLCERKIRRKSNLPFLLLTLDEHSSAVGVNTRLEAFIDMIKWRKKYENNVSAHG